MSEAALELKTVSQRRTLWWVLGLNIAISAGFFVTGVTADSSALIANGLDNLSDSLVYAISLLALTRPPKWKRGAARVSGILLMAFGAGVLFDAGRRFFLGSDPLGPTMIVMALIAAVVNGLSIWLLTRLKEPDVNIRSATTFSTNDFISNAGILVAGGLVLWTGANWPDLAVGVAVATIAAKGGIDILKDAQQEAENDS